MKNSLQLPPIRVFMADMTTITTKACTRWLLAKLQENIEWAQMEIKPSKSCSVLIFNGQLTNEKLVINN